MTTIQARLITNMPWGGVANQGQHVLFDLQFEGGHRERYACSISLLPLMLNNLTGYGNMAEVVRTKMPNRSVVEAAPYRVTNVSRSGYTPDGSLVSVEFDTTHGFPLSVAMTLDQARQTIEFLQREILLASESPGRDRRN